MFHKRNHGWRPDLPDHRDYAFAAVHAPPTSTYPDAAMDLLAKAPPVVDQGQLGSCTGNAIACAVNFIWSSLIGSRLFIYYKERSIEHTIRQDAGAMIRDGAKVVASYGVPPETDWPYVISKFAKAPSRKANADAKLHRVTSYSRLSGRDDFRRCIAAGHPFVIGFTVYESFESDAVARTGHVPMPAKTEKVLGGHAVCVIGYDKNSPIGDAYYARNSWGDGWGDKGNFWMPAAYFEDSNLADDAWTFRS